MSIINDALKKTQQARKVSAEKRHVAKSEPIIQQPERMMPAAVASATSPTTATRNIMTLDFWLTWKMATGLSIIALLVMLFNQHSLQNHASSGSQKTSVVFDSVVLADNHMRTALINKQIMHLGDTLNGLKIIAINRDSVDLQGDNGVLEIKAGATYEL